MNNETTSSDPQGWIPVEDGLPPHNHTILFCTKDVYDPAMMPLQGYYDENEKVWMGYLWSQKRTDVTHWMYMPHPPLRS